MKAVERNGHARIKRVEIVDSLLSRPTGPALPPPVRLTEVDDVHLARVAEHEMTLRTAIRSVATGRRCGQFV